MFFLARVLSENRIMLNKGSKSLLVRPDLFRKLRWYAEKIMEVLFAIQIVIVCWLQNTAFKKPKLCVILDNYHVGVRATFSCFLYFFKKLLSARHLDFSCYKHTLSNLNQRLGFTASLFPQWNHNTAQSKILLTSIKASPTCPKCRAIYSN